MPGLTYETDDNGRKSTNISQSWLNTFFNCPELARREVFEQLESSGTDATAIGTGLHSAAEAHLKDGADYDQCLDAAVASFRHEVSLPGFRWVQIKSEDTAIKYLTTCVNSWWDGVRPQLGAPVAVEWKFKTLLFTRTDKGAGELDVYLSGALDFVDDNGIIWDWKTAGDADKYGKRKAWEYERWSIQPTAYTLGWFRETGEYAPFTFAVVMKGAQPKEAQFLTVERDERHWAWLTRQVESVMDLAESRLSGWPLRDQHALCSERWCPAWSTCKGAFIGP